jgi:hypothetical protein
MLVKNCPDKPQCPREPYANTGFGSCLRCGIMRLPLQPAWRCAFVRSSNGFPNQNCDPIASVGAPNRRRDMNIPGEREFDLLISVPLQRCFSQAQSSALIMVQPELCHRDTRPEGALLPYTFPTSGQGESKSCANHMSGSAWADVALFRRQFTSQRGRA